MNIDYNKIIKEKAIIIWYFGGMRGNSIYRILAAHPEVYWDSALHISSHEILQHPLDLPETVSGFNAPDEITTDAEKKGFIKDINYLQFAYTTCHTAGYIGDINTNEMIKAWITSKSYLDKKLFVIYHPAKKYRANEENFYLPESLLTLDDKPHIWIYGTLDRLNMTKTYYNPSPNPLAYNLNLDALYSTDYSTFETEYYKLIAHFNLTSCLNRVRAFILLSIERDKYISKFYMSK
jgi:hypothetical protein